MKPSESQCLHIGTSIVARFYYGLAVSPKQLAILVDWFPDKYKWEHLRSTRQTDRAGREFERL